MRNADVLDAPLPTAREIEGGKHCFTLVEQEDSTVRQLIATLDGGRGHRIFVGTPEQVADELHCWF
ncbi:hypothetical protein [Nocardia sp. NPDC051570]|uniref:hypothetical protein n=1 Tax=Nocardia sp. NPDC051570 TaxID=3364324 RepID=UPI003799031F